MQSVYGQCCLFCLMLTLSAYPIQYHYSLHVSETFQLPQNKVWPIDIDNDSIDEIASIEQNRKLNICDFEGRILSSTLTPADSSSHIGIIPYAKSASFFLYWSKIFQDSIIYFVEKKRILPNQGTPGKIKNLYTFYRHSKDKVQQFQDESLTYISNFQNSKGEELSLFCFYSGWNTNGGIRGLVAFKLPTFDLVWEYHIGPVVAQCLIEDVDNDGADEIIIGTYSPGNGLKANNLSDDSTYVLCFEPDGSLKWSFLTGPLFTGCNISIMKQMDKYLLFVHRVRGDKNRGVKQDALWLLDPQTGHIQNSALVSYLTSVPNNHHPHFCSDINGDDIDEAVIGTNAGFVKIYDNTLVEIASSQNFGSPVCVRKVSDLDGDGAVEIIVSIRDKLLVLSRQLTVLSELNIFSKILYTVDILRTAQGNELLIGYSDGGKYFYNILELKRTRFALPQVSKKTSAVFIVMAAILSLGVLFFFLRQRKKYHELVEGVINSPLIRNQIIIVSEKGMIGRAGAAWQNLLGIGEDQDREVVLFDQKVFQSEQEQLTKLLTGRQKRIDFEINRDENVNTYRIEHLPLISTKGKILYLHESDEDLYVKHLKLWAPTAQRLAHSIKSPLTTVSLNLDDVKKTLQDSDRAHDKEAVANIQDIFDQIKRIEQMCNDFMHFAKFEKPQLAPTAINSVIIEWVNEWRPRKKSIELHFDLQENLPDALVDERYLYEACQHVFTNALESLNGNGHVTVSTQKAELYAKSGGAATFVQLSFHDTGCGIPPRYLENIKKPYFTTKANGSGLGLSVVGKNMDMMNGKFDITSVEGIGTTLLLFLPVAG